jgi:hypothetical protein
MVCALVAWGGRGTACCQVEYPAGQVSPTALVSALTRAGVRADTLNSVADKLLAATYLQGGVSLEALSSSTSLLRDQSMHGGPVKPTVVLAVKTMLGVRPLAFRGLHHPGPTDSRKHTQNTPPSVSYVFECVSALCALVCRCVLQEKMRRKIREVRAGHLPELSYLSWSPPPTLVPLLYRLYLSTVICLCCPLPGSCL